MSKRNTPLKRNNNKLLIEKGTKGLLEAVLELASTAITKQERLILTEFLINKKTFEEIESIRWVIPPLQKRWFKSGLKKLEYFLNQINDLLADSESNYKQLKRELDSLRAENANLRWESEQIKSEQIIRKSLTKETKQLLSVKLKDLKFSARLQNVFKAYDLETLADLVKMEEWKFANTRNVGKTSILELEEFFSASGLSWGMNI